MKKIKPNTLHLIDTLDHLIAKTIYMLTSQITFMLWVGKEHYVLSNNEELGMNNLHRGLIEEYKEVSDGLAKEDVKGVFIDTLDSHIATLDYAFTSNLCFLDYVVKNDLGITDIEETGLFFTKDTLEDVFLSYAKELQAHLIKE